MSVVRARYAKIRQLASSILREHSITAAPVQVENLIRRYGVELRHGDLGDVSGLLARTATGAIIGVNRVHAQTRQRFTLAHELGHYLLHRDLESHSDTDFRVKFRNRRSSEATDVEEIEANFFAACLLMPTPFLNAHRGAEALGDDQRVAELAGVFQVSPHAMSLRLVNEYARHRPY